MRGPAGEEDRGTSGEPRAGRFIWCLGRPLCGIISGQKPPIPTWACRSRFDVWAPPMSCSTSQNAWIPSRQTKRFSARNQRLYYRV